MSSTSARATGDVVRDLLVVVDLLRDPELARLYAVLTQADTATGQEVADTLDRSEEAVTADLERLVDAGVVEGTVDDQPQAYTDRRIEMTVTADDGECAFTITPALIDAVGRRETDEDVDTYVDRHGIGGLATALTYAVARERGSTTHRLMARDLDLSPLEAEIILQALEPVVSEHFDIEESGVSVADIEGVDRDVADDDA